MKKYKKVRDKERGFVMIASLLILLVLTMVGIAVNKNTTTEWQIAMNDRLHKETFYLAEAATELAFEVVVNCSESNCPDPPCIVGKTDYIGSIPNHIGILDDGILQRYADKGKFLQSDDDKPDIMFPYPATDEQPYANINVASDPEAPEGSALQMAAGYEGLGKGIGSYSATRYYIKTQQVGKNGSSSTICAQYLYSGQPQRTTCN